MTSYSQHYVHMRCIYYLIALGIWICLLPVGYLLLRKAAKSPVDGSAGCLGYLFGIPHRRDEARARLRVVHIILLVLVVLYGIGIGILIATA